MRHRTVEEIWHVVQGTGRVWVRELDGAERMHVVGPGVSLLIPTGCAFQFAAAEGGPLRFLCYTAPPWPGDGEAEPVDRGGLGPPRL